MYLVMALVAVLGFGSANLTIAAAAADPATSAAALDQQPPGPGGVPAPRVEPEGTTPATWATLIWIVLGLAMFALLVGAALFALRTNGRRRFGRLRE